MNDFLLIKFSLDRKFDDFIQNSIYNYNIIGFEVDDPREKLKLIENLPAWEVSDLKIVDDGKIKYGVYFTKDDEGKAELDRLVEFLENSVSDFKYSFEHIDNSNWEDEWKKSYTSFEIGNRILVTPSWEDIHETDRVVIEIDPKMAFGTGTHETTALCMEYVENEDLTGKRILDIGCGSGILSILASKLGAKSVDACDIDPIALESANENIKINNTSNVSVFYSDLLSEVEGKYDVIFANILAEIIVILLEDVDKYLEKNGILILSGIINPNAHLVIEKLKEINYDIVDGIVDGEWTLISARRKDV